MKVNILVLRATVGGMMGLELDHLWSVEAGIFGLGHNGPWPFREFKMGACGTVVTNFQCRNKKALASPLSITSHHV